MPFSNQGQGAAVVTVSVVICAYNAGATLARAMESALAQSGVGLQVIVVDDHSSDDTYDIAAGYARDQPCVQVVRLERNLGPANARNVALDHATGDWIALLDADDAFESGRLMTLLGIAATWRADMVADNLWLVDGTSGRSFDRMLHKDRLPTQRLVTARTFVQNNMPIDIKRKYGLLKPIIKRRFLDEHNLRYDSNVHYGEDFLFYLECLIKGGRFVLVPEPLYYYALSRGSMTRTRSIGQAEQFLEHCDSLLERSDTRRVPGLVHMLTQRSFALHSDLVYIQFMTALKRRRLGEALGMFLGNADLAPFILLHLQRVATLRVRQFFAGLFDLRS